MPALPNKIVRTSLNTAQVRVLLALYLADGPLSRQRICDAVADEYPTASKYSSWLTAPLGSNDEERRGDREKSEGYPSLLTLGYVSTEVLDIDGKGERVYEITKAGEKALALSVDLSALAGGGAG